MTAAFRRVLIPVEFEVADDHELAADRTIEVEPGHWIVLGLPTIRALELGAELAKGGDVYLVHATPDLLSTAVYGGPEGTWLPNSTVQELNESARRHSRFVLNKIGERHCKGVNVVCQVDPGPPVEVIKQAAAEHPPDAIVLAASGRGRVRRALLGSTADKVIRQAFCPVIVVPSGTE